MWRVEATGKYSVLVIEYYTHLSGTEQWKANLTETNEISWEPKDISTLPIWVIDKVREHFKLKFPLVVPPTKHSSWEQLSNLIVVDKLKHHPVFPNFEIHGSSSGRFYSNDDKLKDVDPEWLKSYREVQRDLYWEAISTERILLAWETESGSEDAGTNTAT